MYSEPARSPFGQVTIHLIHFIKKSQQDGNTSKYNLLGYRRFGVHTRSVVLNPTVP